MSAPTFFKTQSDWRRWLEKNHAAKPELLVGFYKKATGKPSIDWKQSVDEALCFGWIDGVRKSLGDDAYTIRFTPRRSTSIWSAININRIKELTDLGLMHESGLKAFNERNIEKTNRYSFEQSNIAFTKEQERAFKKNAKAWKQFLAMPPSYRKPATWWVISAKQEATKEKRLATLIQDSEAGIKIKPLRPYNKK
ncbi:MAG TPA: YdeI/OmpD-associated family protein [Candidatus Kapabacteria bacterium]|nr:YdeI/OmpD-associated family protein [Candidatus Kapabacteria bacterium]